MRVVFGSDPNAKVFKDQLIEYTKTLGIEIVDFGSDDPIYANTAIRLAEAVSAKEFDRGIIVCGTGIGVSIAANKVKGVYAACIHDIYQAQRAALSNNANIITMGSQVVGIELAKCMVKEYFSHEFDENGRSFLKVKKIVDFENNIYR
ncbi:ribose 5-phosphate isomerase B [Alkalispirochaeta americana]|uniref:Ribose 5-phosphate isomerase B n=1 Tax=Alkalispirochaeta americana TaxID=159291 RepID=A0A1N6USS5_9SPIO|nr:RpiB/LacA/LacB family sugar-phosphate isomerase [Alkalispirochaeta americana]SIQ68703.1 ribose 5-phosphate isomerase B [Alkalispirochaeta americana]